MFDISPQAANIWKAMQSVQRAVGAVKRDGINERFSSRYATLERVIETIRPHYLEAELIVISSLGEVVDQKLSVTTTIVHVESGEWIRATTQMPLVKFDPQAMGSAATYCQRYSLMALFNLPPTDDDAESAMPTKQLEVSIPTVMSPLSVGDMEFVMPTIVTAETVFGIPQTKEDWGAVVDSLGVLVRAADWPELKKFWLSNHPILEAMKAKYPELYAS